MRQVMGEFAKSYKAMAESGADCLHANPTGALPPAGSIFDPHAINRAVALELARFERPELGDNPTIACLGSAMATSHCNPEIIKTLIENVLDSNAFALKEAKKGKPK